MRWTCPGVAWAIASSPTSTVTTCPLVSSVASTASTTPTTLTSCRATCAVRDVSRSTSSRSCSSASSRSLLATRRPSSSARCPSSMSDPLVSSSCAMPRMIASGVRSSWETARTNPVFDSRSSCRSTATRASRADSARTVSWSRCTRDRRPRSNSRPIPNVPPTTTAQSRSTRLQSTDGRASATTTSSTSSSPPARANASLVTGSPATSPQTPASATTSPARATRAARTCGRVATAVPSSSSPSGPRMVAPASTRSAVSASTSAATARAVRSATVPRVTSPTEIATSVRKPTVATGARMPSGSRPQTPRWSSIRAPGRRCCT